MFPDRLKKLREEKGINQKELATELNVSQQTVSRWEGGVSEADFSTLLKIATYFNTTVDYLIGADLLTESDIKNIQKLNEVLVENGIIPPSEEMTPKEFENAIHFLRVNKPFIFEDK